MWKRLAGSVGIIGALVVAGTAERRGEAIPLTERPDHVTSAVVIVDAPAEEIYALMTDYANWRQVLSDVTSVRVEGGGRDDARVRFHSRAIGHTVTVQFENDPGRAIRFRGVEGPPGGRARGEFRLTPIDGGTRTQVDASFYLDVVGPAGWLVRDKATRAMRRTKLQADMSDVMAYFAARRSTRAAEGARSPPSGGPPS